MNYNPFRGLCHEELVLSFLYFVECDDVEAVALVCDAYDEDIRRPTEFGIGTSVTLNRVVSIYTLSERSEESMIQHLSMSNFKSNLMDNFFKRPVGAAVLYLNDFHGQEPRRAQPSRSLYPMMYRGLPL